MAVLVGGERAEKPRGDWDSIGAGATCPRQNRHATQGNLKSYVNLLMGYKMCQEKKIEKSPPSKTKP